MSMTAPSPRPTAKQYLFGELQKAQAFAADLIDEMAAAAAVSAARIAELEAENTALKKRRRV